LADYIAATRLVTVVVKLHHITTTNQIFTEKFHYEDKIAADWSFWYCTTKVFHQLI